MPAYRFSWDLFDERSIAAFAADLGFTGPPADALAYLTSHVPRPSDDFVQRTKRSLTTVWLPQQRRIAAAIVRELFDVGIGPMGKMPEDVDGCARYLERCRHTSGLRGRLLGRLISFGDRDKRDDYSPEGGFVPRFGAIVPARQPAEERRPYSHQAEAWTAMDRTLAGAKTSGVFKGVVVMPTGAGKTKTAVHWLLRQWVNDGGRVLWLAHRDELLRQAAKTFYELAGLAAGRDKLRIRLVSGQFCGFHQIDEADDIILCSVVSLARSLASARALLQDPRLFVVVDEAHHAPAGSYRDAIGVLSQARSHHLLGLTATPTRTAEHERPELARLFGGHVIYQVSPSELIARELLAKPIPIIVRTGVQGDRDLTREDLDHLRDFHSPSADMQARLGRDEPRRRVIVDHYVEHIARYGKTLVFAPDVRGAALLTDAFRARLPEGVEAEYLASWRPDGVPIAKAGESDILDRFRDPRSGLDVLVNVDMLTEGVDLPMTRTVFLARPTSSEILLRQMFGRALRGPAAGGHLEANIVSFEDHWQTFRDVLSPMQLLADMLPLQETPPAEPVPPVAPEPDSEFQAPEAELPPPSWDQVLALSRAIRASVSDSDADVFEAVPHGMFRLDYVVEEEAVQHYVHVYEHQKTCWDALFARLATQPSSNLENADPELIYADFFGDCDDPAPSAIDVATVVERARRGDPLPAYVPLAGRQQCDPRDLARIARAADMRSSEIDALLAERHSALAQVIYPTAVDFRRAFDDGMRELAFPQDGRPPKGIVLFEPPSGNPLRPGPHHDLTTLLATALARGSQLLETPLSHSGPLEWTSRYIKGWFGMADLKGPYAGRIRINRLLDSADVSVETMTFLMWHEFLHLHLQQGHTPQFRRQERLWPGYQACDREMDSLHEKFGVQYW